MDITNLFLVLVASVGMTHIIVDGVIFDKIREIIKARLPAKIAHLFSCYQCTGTWCGFGLSYLMFGLDWPIMLMFGFAASFLAPLAANIMNYLEANTVISLNDDEK